jgi:hypothetical protein
MPMPRPLEVKRSLPVVAREGWEVNDLRSAAGHSISAPSVAVYPARIVDTVTYQV